MKQIIFLLFILVTFASCNHTTGSGTIISETRKVNDFTGITVGGDFDVEVKIGSVTEVVVEADDNIMNYIETKITGNTLKIGTEDLHNYSDVHMKVYITTPSLQAIRSSASARVIVQDVLINTSKLTFKASSGSNIQSALDAPEVESDASSGGSVILSGKTRIYSAKTSSGAEIKSWDLLSETTTVSASSGASAKVHASVKLNASASSGAAITYHGAATLNQSVSSGASITKNE